MSSLPNTNTSPKDEESEFGFEDIDETFLTNKVSEIALSNTEEIPPTNKESEFAFSVMEETCSSSENSKRQNYLIWDDYFMAMALLSAKRSKDPVTQVGACIVDKQNRIVSIGYNGFPRNCSDDEFPWSKEKKLYVVHAEANAILNSNSASLVDTCLYTTLFPCNECAKLIIQSGIRHILYISDKYGFKAKYVASKRMFDTVGITYTQYEPNQKQIILNFNDI